MLGPIMFLCKRLKKQVSDGRELASELRSANAELLTACHRMLRAWDMSGDELACAAAYLHAKLDNMDRMIDGEWQIGTVDNTDWVAFTRAIDRARTGTEHLLKSSARATA